MDTNKLHTFSVLARTESVRKAAELLRVTPSAVSKTIRALEEDLGIALVAPLGRGITITSHGRRLALEAGQVLKSLDLLRDQLRTADKTAAAQPLRIATFEVFSTSFLGALDKIGWKNRGLVLHEALPGELERMVEQGQVDFGITYLPVSYPGVDHIKVTSVEMGVFKRKGTFASCRQEDLPFVVPAQPLNAPATRIRGLDGWPENAYRRKVLHEVTLMESALELCRHGRCAGYFPVFIIQEHNRKHRAQYQLERHPSPYSGRACYSDVYLVKRRDRAEDSDARTLAKLLRVGTRSE